MNKQPLPVFAFLCLMASLALAACDNAQLPEPMLPESCMDSVPTYQVDIKPIIDNSCAYAGCHLDGSAPGIYTDYQGLVNVIESGKFQEKVISLRDDPVLGMPPDNAPDGRPDDLSQEELELIQCWLENDYPEN